MAIKISTDGILDIIRPINNVFTEDEIAESLGTEKDFVDIIDMGVFVIVVDVATNKSLNTVASLYFRFPVFGSIIAMNGHEIPASSPMVTKENTRYIPEEFEEGFLKSVKDVLETYKDVSNIEKYKEVTDIAIESGERKSKTVRKRRVKKTVYYFDPDDPTNGVKLSKEETDFIKEFYHFSYENLEKTKNVEKTVLYETKDWQIKFMPDKVEKTLTNMMNYFASLEEYERCAIIRDKLSLHKQQIKLKNAVQE